MLRGFAAPRGGGGLEREGSILEGQPPPPCDCPHNSNKGRGQMSDVTRKADGFHKSDDGRSPRILVGVASREGGQAPGHRQVSELVDGVARLAPRTVRLNRARELERAAGFHVQTAILPWWGTRADLVSEAIEDRRTLILHIAAACNAERQREERHHWTYDAARHSQLISLLKTERAELEALEALQ